MKSLATTLAAASVFLSACSSELNEGLVRVGVPSSPESGNGMVSAAVFSASNGQVIKPGDDFQITLISAFICDVREGFGGFDAFSGTNTESTKCGDRDSQGVGTRAEVAILVGFRFRGSGDGSSTPEERLVFFSDDVRESGQLLNFINVPVYGPAPYQLATSEMRLTILELDEQEAEEQSVLLNALSSAGKEFSSPVQGAVLGVLSSIGDALIKSNKDDREFRFEMMFDAPFQTVGSGTRKTEDAGSQLERGKETETRDGSDGGTGTTTPILRLPLREGYLAFVRREARLGPRSEIGYESMSICPNLGIISTDHDCKDGDRYVNDTTWLLLRVSRENPAVTDAQVTRTMQDALTARKGTLTAEDVASIGEALKQLDLKTAPQVGNDQRGGSGE